MQMVWLHMKDVVNFASTTLYPQFADAPDVVCLQETHFTKDDEKGYIGSMADRYGFRS